MLQMSLSVSPPIPEPGKRDKVIYLQRELPSIGGCNVPADLAAHAAGEDYEPDGPWVIVAVLQGQHYSGVPVHFALWARVYTLTSDALAREEQERRKRKEAEDEAKQAAWAEERAQRKKEAQEESRLESEVRLRRKAVNRQIMAEARGLGFEAPRVTMVPADVLAELCRRNGLEPSEDRAECLSRLQAHLEGEL